MTIAPLPAGIGIAYTPLFEFRSVLFGDAVLVTVQPQDLNVEVFNIFTVKKRAGTAGVGYALSRRPIGKVGASTFEMAVALTVKLRWTPTSGRPPPTLQQAPLLLKVSTSF
ncbi:hypothetical protein [Paraburkholderia sacchari]|uniref:hypothetical protein n=1 Tax=Paraburkholderia sacchari TaxID=159450 RepID=UPI0039A444A2